MKADDWSAILLALLAVLAGILIATWWVLRRKHAGLDREIGSNADWRNISDRIR